MRLHIVAAVLLISTSNALSPMKQAVGQTSGVDRPMQATLESLRSRSRPLLIFAPTSNDPRFLKQAQLFASGSNQLHDRQVVLVQLSYEKETEPSVVISNSVQLADFSRDEASKARRRFNIAPGDFAVILLGKDGGEKFRSHTPVTIERLNSLIDAMPMRQQEVQNGNAK